MDKPQLIAPDIKHKDSYVAALREGLDRVPLPEDKIQEIAEDFEGWLARQQDWSTPVILPDGRLAKRVPQTVLWLVDKDRFIGRISLRHGLTEHLRRIGGHIGYAVRKSERRKGYGHLMLQLALPCAKSLGLDKVLITCDDDNLGSSRVIEGAGGVLEDKIRIEGQQGLERRYWLTL